MNAKKAIERFTRCQILSDIECNRSANKYGMSFKIIKLA